MVTLGRYDAWYTTLPYRYVIDRDRRSAVFW